MHWPSKHYTDNPCASEGQGAVGPLVATVVLQLNDPNIMSYGNRFKQQFARNMFANAKQYILTFKIKMKIMK